MAGKYLIVKTAGCKTGYKEDFLALQPLEQFYVQQNGYPPYFQHLVCMNPF